jgi:hypothetical protein
MNRGDEAISVELRDCRASLAMTKKEGPAITQEVIANIKNTYVSPAYLNQVKGVTEPRVLRRQRKKVPERSE